MLKQNVTRGRLNGPAMDIRWLMKIETTRMMKMAVDDDDEDR